MPGPIRALVMTGAMLTAAVAALAGAAAAATASPTLITSNFACGNSVCEVGPGNFGVPFAAGLIGTGGPAWASAGLAAAIPASSDPAAAMAASVFLIMLPSETGSG
jgi:hypothetical protein